MSVSPEKTRWETIGRVTLTDEYVTVCSGHRHHEDTLEFTGSTGVKIEVKIEGHHPLRTLGLERNEPITWRTFSPGWVATSTETVCFEGESFFDVNEKPFAVKNKGEYIYALSDRASGALGRVGRIVMRVWVRADESSVLVQFPLKKNLVHMYSGDYRVLNAEEQAQLSPIC